MTNNELSKSPLNRLGITLADEQREAVLDRVEKRAIEHAEDDQPASQETSGPLVTRRAIIDHELFWYGRLLDSCRD